MTTLQLLGERVSVPVRSRPMLVTAGLVVALLAVFVYALATGDFVIPAGGVIRALLGIGTPAQEFIVTTLRLPRAVLAIAAGAALAVGGALFQSVTGNPLASPDVVGLQSGAATGALLQIVVFSATGGAVVVGALLGSVGATVLILLLVPLRQAGGPRFILVGIAIAALFAAVNEVLLTRTDLTTAIAATVWQTGSLSGATWDQIWPIVLALAVLLPVAVLLGRQLRCLALGDDLAQALGVNVTRVRVVTLATAVGLTATATAGAGPLLFVALASGQIARRLTGRPGPAVLSSALIGALLTLVADLIAQRLFGSTGIPAGIVTGVLGGIYLAGLLAREWKRT